MNSRWVDCEVDGSVNDAGDCLRACLASVLGLPKDVVPHFLKDDSPAWFDDMQSWLGSIGLRCLCLPVTPELLPVYIGALGDVMVIAGVYVDGDESRRHAVVAKAGKIIHDPKPWPFQKTESLEHVFDFLVIIPKDPAAVLS